ncbi:DUF4258 domain-containing protein [Mangrovimonas sp. DI 80]|uniref:DUF4258 domain-containing protein n=1 Tax=Mangrovimonas sp. DI 80 TaxID=1779330 RepID=UPI0009774D9D|nr:DUF4258 domain-containing protein [Mangrovimonas sp. DI 80]OMP30695.1 hypothetical protein BKM32_10685 [Mangrovimonas sp. DI 80]
MKLIQRIGYYLGGFSIGLIFLAFFLRGKNTSCDYGPNARTIKNIALKKKVYSKEALATMQLYDLDTTAVSNLIWSGNVNFSKSQTKPEDCKTYVIENSLESKEVVIDVENCDSLVTIVLLHFK